MLTLKEASRLGGQLLLNYEVSHSTPGRDGTTLTAPLQLRVVEGKVSAKIEVDMATAELPTEALDKLCVYLERMIEGIKKRRDTWLPI
jgi:hypothetical protein